MMKTYTLIFISFLFSAFTVKAQWANTSTWSYDFGARTTAIEYTNTTGLQSFWANPTAGNGLFDVAASPGNTLGIAIHASAQTGGKIIANTDNSLSLLMGTVSGATHVRFSATDIPTKHQGGVSTSVVRHAFTLKTGTSTVGYLTYGLGSTVGTNTQKLFTPNGGNLSGANNHIFGALRFTYNASNSNVGLTYRASTTPANGNAAVSPTGGGALQKDNTYLIEVYANNSGETTAYEYTAPNGNPYSLADSYIHVWIANVNTPTTWTKYDARRSTENTTSTGVDSPIAVAAPLNAFTFQVFGGAITDGDTAGERAFTISNLSLSYASGASTLPVNLTSFTASNQGSVVKLNWQTASEQNNSHFEVERSEDGATFSKIGTVAGAGTTNNIKNYTLTDTAPLAGTSYYRLKQVDLDGKSVYVGDIVVVKTNLTSESYAVSVINESTLKGFVVVDKKSTASFKIYDINGKTLVKSDILLAQGVNTFNQDISQLGKGIYVATLNVSGKTLTQKIIK